VEDGTASTFNPPQSIVAQIRNKALVRILLEYAAGILQPGDRFDFASPPSARRDEELQWVLDAGLGPMLYRVADEQGWDAVPAGGRKKPTPMFGSRVGPFVLAAQVNVRARVI